MTDEKRLDDDTLENVSGGMEVDQYEADYNAFVELNCTICDLAKYRVCQYPNRAGAGQHQVFDELGRKPDAVCPYKIVR